MKQGQIKKPFVSIVCIIFFLLLIVLFINEESEKSNKTTQIPIQQKKIITFSKEMKPAPERGYQIYIDLLSRRTFNRGDLMTFFHEEYVNEIPDERINLEVSKVYCSNGDYDSARKLLEKELWDNPCNTEVQNELGNIYCSHNEQANLHRMASISIAQCKGDARVYTNLSHIFNSCDDFEQGKKILEAGIESNPTEYHLRYVFGDYLMARGLFQESESEFLKAIECNENDAAGYFNLGELYEKTGRTEKAQEYYSIAAQISPDYAEIVQDLISNRDK